MDHGRVLAGLRASAAAGMGDVIVAMDAAVDAVAVEVTLAMEVSASSSVCLQPSAVHMIPACAHASTPTPTPTPTQHAKTASAMCR